MPAKLFQRSTPVTHRLAEQKPCLQAVPGRADRQVDHVPRLLSAQRGTDLLHALEHVAVADIGDLHPHVPLPHGPVEAQVAHAGDHHRVTRQAALLHEPGGQQGEDLVAVDDGPRAIDRQDPVGVSVEGKSEVELPLHDKRGEGAGVGRAALGVDVDPVGAGEDRLHVGAGSGEGQAVRPGTRPRERNRAAPAAQRGRP